MSEVGAIFTQVNGGELYLSKEVDGYLEIIKSAYVEVTSELDKIKELQIKDKQEIEGMKELHEKDKQALLTLQEELKNVPDSAEMKTFYESELQKLQKDLIAEKGTRQRIEENLEKKLVVEQKNMQEVKEKLKAVHEEQINDLMDKHKEHIQNLLKTHDSEINELQELHSGELSEMQSASAKQIGELTAAHDELKNKLEKEQETNRVEAKSHEEIFINATKDAEEYVIRIKDEIATMMSETETKCKEQIRMTNNNAFKIIMDARAKATEMINKAGGK